MKQCSSGIQENGHADFTTLDGSVKSIMLYFGVISLTNISPLYEYNDISINLG